MYSHAGRDDLQRENEREGERGRSGEVKGGRVREALASPGVSKLGERSTLPPPLRSF